MTPDPAGMIDGPNLYTYARNNPVRFVDPWGLCADEREDFDRFMDFLREQGVERGVTDPFIHEQITDDWDNLPQDVRDWTPGDPWGDYVVDKGNHDRNRRLPGGYHVTQDGDGPVAVHFDAHNPLNGPIETFDHGMSEVNIQNLPIINVYDDWQ
jgi:uncharacterized protein RhaS with RHS repeats